MKKALTVLVLILVATVAHAALVGFQVAFTAQVEQSHIGYAKLGLEAQGGDPAALKAHCIAAGKAACEQEFRRLVSVGRCMNDQNLKVQLDAVRTKDLVNVLE